MARMADSCLPAGANSQAPRPQSIYKPSDFAPGEIWGAPNKIFAMLENLRVMVKDVTIAKGNVSR